MDGARTREEYQVVPEGNLKRRESNQTRRRWTLNVAPVPVPVSTEIRPP